MHELTVSEAGRLGGEATKTKYGVEFYEKIGTVGGNSVLAKFGKEFYSEIGRS